MPRPRHKISSRTMWSRSICTRSPLRMTVACAPATIESLSVTAFERSSCTMPMTTFAKIMTMNSMFLYEPVQNTIMAKIRFTMLNSVTKLSNRISLIERVCTFVSTFTSPAFTRACTSSLVRPVTGFVSLRCSFVACSFISLRRSFSSLHCAFSVCALFICSVLLKIFILYTFATIRL